MDTNKYTEAVRLLNHCQGVEDNVELHRRLISVSGPGSGKTKGNR